jgi:hypothetical protein
MPLATKYKRKNRITGKSTTVKKLDDLSGQPINPRLQRNRNKIASVLRNLKSGNLTTREKDLLKFFFPAL